MAKGNSMDDFLVQLGFDDKKAIKDLNRFMTKVKKMNPVVNPRVNTTQGLKVAQAKYKAEKDNATKLHKTRINYIKIEAARKKRLDQNNATEQKIKNFGNTPLMRTVAKGNSPLAKESLKEYERLIRDGSALAKEQVRGLTQALRQEAQVIRKVERDSRKLNAVQRGFGDSTNHMIRSYASAFAILGATTHINKVGQDFESLNSAMLAAMGTEKQAAEEIAFLDKMTDRLGMSLLDTASAYTKFTFAAKGKLDTEEARELFEGLSEVSTVMGLSKEKMKLAQNAISQMMNKSVISSEELRLQLAESLPSAIPIFAKAMGVSTQEMFRQIKTGKVLARRVT